MITMQVTLFAMLAMYLQSIRVYAKPMESQNCQSNRGESARSMPRSDEDHISGPRYLHNVDAWDTTNLPLSPRLLLDPDVDTAYQKCDRFHRGESSMTRGLLEMENNPCVTESNSVWVPTVPRLTPSGRLHAGWYDSAKPEDKAIVTEYLNSAWLYPLDSSGIAQTRQRMRERIGPAEAEVLKEWKRYPNESFAIAMATISKQKDPTNSINTPRGRMLFERLMYEYNIGSVTASDYVRYALEVEKLADQQDSEIISYILDKYQANKARGKNKIN